MEKLRYFFQIVNPINAVQSDRITMNNYELLEPMHLHWPCWLDQQCLQENIQWCTLDE